MGEITDLLKKYNIYADKSLSQNFLVDAHVLKKIIEAADLDENTTVIEIGSGPGSLTKELLRVAGKVKAIELDGRLCTVLLNEYAEYAADSRLTVINADILKTDLNPIIAAEAEKGHKVKVCANLPYHITTPVIMRLLENTKGFESLTLMMQKEVANRLLASPGDKSYGAITPAVNYHADVRYIANVPPNCFIPRPGVYSSVVHFKILEQKRVSPKSEALMLDVIKASFGQRRKTIFNSISNILLPKLKLSKAELMECFSNEKIINLGITATVRGEMLGLAEFAALSDVIFSFLDKKGRVL